MTRLLTLTDPNEETLHALLGVTLVNEVGQLDKIVSYMIFKVLTPQASPKSFL